MRSAASWEHWDVGSIPSHWVKDPALPQLQFSSWPWLRPDPWPRNSICYRTAKKKRRYIQRAMRSSLVAQVVKDPAWVTAVAGV